MIYVWYVFYGIGIGITTFTLPLLLPRYFGRKYFGGIDGMRWLLNAPPVLVAPIYAGWVYDTTHSYMGVFVLFTVLVTVAGVIACFILPPKPGE